MSRLSSPLAALLSFIFILPSVTAFSFSFQQPPTQCDNLALSWTGGTPPFQLLISPAFGSQRNISIPASAFSNGAGSYPAQMPFQKGQQVVLTMSDATGFNSGGTTNILTVGASQGGSCNTTDPGVAFSYELNTALQQCRPFTFSGYSAASQPVTITGIIPGGDAFVLTPPPGSNSFSWNAVVARGTNMIFMMTDSQGQPGGVSDIETVTSSDDATCLNSNSPTSTSNPPSTPTTSKASHNTSTSTSLSSTSTSSPTATAPASNGISIAAIAGTVIGALLFLAVIITLGLFCLRKRRDQTGGGGGNGGGGGAFRRQSRILDSRVDLTYDPASAPGATQYGMPPPMNDGASPYQYNSAPGAAYASNPFLDQSISSNHRPPPSQYDASSMYSDTRYAQSEVDRYDASSQYGQYGYNGGAYQQPPQRQSQLYPPQQQNYPPAQPPPTVDPYVLQYPTTETGPSTPQSSSNRQSTSTSTSAAQRKAAAAGVTPYKPSRFIIHTDVEDALPPPSEEEVIELPPQYTERRGPLQSATHPSSPGAYAGHNSLGGEESLLPYS